MRLFQQAGFTYITLYEVDQYGNETHWFLDPLNIVHYTKTSIQYIRKDDRKIHFAVADSIVAR
jgi:hypothetical protein